MKTKFFSLLAFAAITVILPSCSKEDLPEKESTCIFCLKQFPSEEKCLEHQTTCDYYRSSSDEELRIDLESDLYTRTNVDPKHWMSQLPDETLVSDLTIPGLHDAATYSYHGMNDRMMKDQTLSYKDAWDYGARAFDLRLGYDDRGYSCSFEGRCKFYHGDNALGVAFGVCDLRNFTIDVGDFFPTKDQLRGETMFLITKCERYSSRTPNINVFEFLVRRLTEKYNEDNMFIAYRSDLKLKDCRGKIIVFTRTEDYTRDYLPISEYHLKSIPVTHISSFPSDGSVTLTKYERGNSYESSDGYVQDMYEVGESSYKDDDVKKKYDAFINALRNRKNYHPKAFFFNGMNAVRGKSGWDVCDYMNGKIVDELAAKTLADEYKQPLGLVLCDYYGSPKWDKGGEYFNPRGQDLPKRLVGHNFRKY